MRMPDGMTILPQLKGDESYNYLGTELRTGWANGDDEFETGGELRDGKGAQIKMGKDSEPLRSGKGRALNVKVAQTCLALHRLRSALGEALCTRVSGC